MRNLVLPALIAVAAAGGVSAATIDFDSQGDCTSPDPLVTFTPQGVTTCFITASPGNGSGALGLVSDLQGPVSIRADFAVAASAVSVDLGDFGSDADDLFLAIYDAADTLLDFADFAFPADFSGTQTLALSGSGIAYALFGTNADDLGFVAADNFTYEISQVPVPATGLLLAGALGLLGLGRSRRQA